MDRKLNLSVDKIKVLNDVSDEQLAIAEVWCCHDQMNSHKLPIDIEAIKNAEPTLFNKPLVASYKNKDFGGHDGDEMEIVGFFPKENNIRYEEHNGKTYLVAQAIMSKIYARWAYEIFTKPNDGNYREVSMEITVLETEDKDDGYTWITSFIFNAITLLGKSHKAACAGSNAQIIKFEELIEHGEQVYRQFSDIQSSNIHNLDFKSKYDDLDFTIPKGVKEQARQGLELRKEYNRGGTSVGLATARYLIKNTVASPEKVRHIAKYFPRHAGDNLTQTNPPSNGLIAWKLWGSDAGRRWSTKLVNAMNKIDEKEMSFEESYEESNLDFNIENLSEKEDYIVKNEQFSLTSRQFVEICENALKDYKYGENEYQTYYIQDYDENYIYVYNYEQNCCQRVPYSLTEGTISIDISNAKDVIRAGYIEVENQNEKEVAVSFAKSNELFAKLNESCGNVKYAKDEQEVAKYSMLDYCESFAYVIDNESKKMFAVPYKYSDEVMEADFANIKHATMKCEASDEEVDMEVMMSMVKAVCSLMEDSFATDDNQEPLGQVARSEKETEDEAETITEEMADEDFESKEEEVVEEETEDEEKEDAEKVEMSAKLEEVTNKFAELEKECAELRTFKENIIEQEKASKIEFAINEVSKTMPKDVIENWRKKVVEFASVDAWTNALKADAFNYIKDVVETKNDGFTRMGLPHSNENNKTSTGLWKKPN